MADIKKISVEVKKVEFSEKSLSRSKIVGLVLSIIVLIEELLIGFFQSLNATNTSFVMLISAVVLISVYFYNAPNGESLARYYLKIILDRNDVYLYSSDDTIYDDINEEEPFKSNKKSNSDDFIIDGDEEMKSNFKNKKDVVLKVKKTTQNILPFTEIYSDGIFKVGEKTYCLICEYAETEYAGLSIDEKRQKYNAYKEIMNALNPDIGYQEFIMNQPIEEEDYEKIIVPANMEHLKDKVDAYNDFIEIERGVVRKAISKAAFKKTIMSFTYTLKNDLDNYDCLFNQFEIIKDALGSLGSNIRQLSIEEVLGCVYKYYHPFDDTKLQIPDNYNKLGKNIKDYMVPMSLNFKSKEIEVGSEYTRILGLTVMTENQILADDLIFNMLDNNYHVTVTKYVRRLDKGTILSKLRQRETSIEKRVDSVTKDNKKTGASTVSSTLMKRLADVTEVLSLLNNADQEIFEVIILCSISAETLDELNDITKIVRGRALSDRAKIKILTQNQKRAYISMLPFGNNYFKAGTDSSLSLHLLTDACGVLIPFSNNLLYDVNGLMYGFDPISKYPIVIDRNKGINSNGFILSMSGAGKSMFSKMEDLQIVSKYPNDYMIIFDPEGEYARVLGMINGEEIIFAPTSENHINPLDISYEEFSAGDISALISEKLELLSALFYAMKGSNITIDEKTVLHNCLNELYSKLFRTSQFYEDMPTMDSLQNMLHDLKETDKYANNLYKILNCYMDEGSMLSGRTTVSLKSQYTIFNLSKCQGAWSAIANTLLLYISDSRSRKLSEENKRLWLKVDELHSFVISSGESSAMGIYLKNTFQRCRKLGHSVQGIMQNISEAMKDDSISIMLKNSNFVVMLRQHKDDLNILKELYSLNDKQCNFLLTAQKGEGLIYYDGKIVQFKNVISKDSLTYKLINTTKDFS